MTDHIRDSEITDALKRAEAAERELAKMRELYRIDGNAIAVLIVIAFVVILMAACLGLSRRDAIKQRDAAQAQSQLYLDGWRECVKDRYGKTPKVTWEDEGGTCYQFTDGSEVCSSSSPLRRIDR